MNGSVGRVSLLDLARDLLSRAGDRAVRGAASMSDPSLEGIVDGMTDLMLAKVEVGSAVFLVKADSEMWESVLDIFV